MAEKWSDTTTHTEHLERDKQAIKLEQVQQRTHIADDVPIQEALDQHLDEDPKRLARIKRKLDLRLTFMLACLYTCAFIDRANLGNANIAGMGEALGLDQGNRYSVVTMIFFVSYAISALACTPIMKVVGASIMTPSVVLAFGVLTIAQGFVNTWGALAAIRFLLGMFEGLMLPSTLFLLQVWYTRYEFHKRQAAYYLVGVASTGLSGLLAYGIEKMDGTEGIDGWRWIFIIEGIATSALALISYAVLIDLPENATKKNIFRMPAPFNKEDAAVIFAHIERDRGDAQTEQFGYKDMFSHLTDWKVWEFGSYVLWNNVCLYAFSFFLPIIMVDGFGYDYAKANLMTFPPYAVSIVYMAAVAYFCDYFHIRGPIMVFGSFLYIVGISMTVFCKDLNVRYAGVFLGVLGLTGNIPTQFAYQHNNIVGQSKRAMCTALMIFGGACGGIIAGNIFREQDAPEYRPAIAFCLCCMIITAILVGKNFFLFTRWNRKADRGEMIIQGQPNFRYTL